MEVPDFSRAEYTTPLPPPMVTAEGGNGSLWRAFWPGLGAALVGCLLYALVGRWLQLGIVSIVVGILVGNAMMRATNGVGGRRFQWMAVGLTYCAVNAASVVDLLWARSRQGVELGSYVPHHALFLLVYGLLGPVFELQLGLGYGALGILILFFGLQAAWRAAKGGVPIVRANETDTSTTLGLR